MEKISDKSEQSIDIKQVQEILRCLSFMDEDIPRIVPDGKISIEYKRAVEIFQKKNNLSVTGVADDEMWQKLLMQHNYYHRFVDIIGVTPFNNNNTTYSINDYGYGVYIIQAVLNTIAENYANINTVEMTGALDSHTIESIKQIQGISGLPQTGRVNYNTWNMMAKLYKIHIDEDSSINGDDFELAVSSQNSVG